jgi:hypothetical protein
VPDESAADDPVAETSVAGTASIVVFALIFLAVAGAGIAAGWYRATYWTWPGLSAAERVHWCGRDYDLSGPTETWRQIAASEPWKIHPVGLYPPLGFSREQLLAATNPAQAKLPPGTPITSCATLLYVRTRSGRYETYSLLGGP